MTLLPASELQQGLAMRVLIAFAAGSLLTSCDPNYSIRGRVLQDDAGVADIEVTLHCFGRVLASAESTRSGDGGAFLMDGVGCIPDTCVLDASSRLVPGSGKIKCISRSFMCGRNECTAATAELQVMADETAP